MSEFVRKYANLRAECADYIRDFLKENGGRYEFVTQEEIEHEDFLDVAWELPSAYIVDKHESHCTYAITSITLDDDYVLSFNGVSLDEYADEYAFAFFELDVACLCDCADSLTVKQ